MGFFAVVMAHLSHLPQMLKIIFGFIQSAMQHIVSMSFWFKQHFKTRLSLCDDFDDHLTIIIYSLGSFTTTLCDSVLSFTYEFAFKDFLKMKQLQ